MSKNQTKTMDTSILKDRFVYIFMNELIDEIDTTEIEIEEHFAQHQFKATSYEEQDRIKTLNIRPLLGEAAYRTIKFDQEALDVWADRAKKFFDLNSQHHSFRSTFESDLNYQAIISSAVKFDYNSDIIRKLFEKEFFESLDNSNNLGRRVVSGFSDQLSNDIDEMIQNAISRSLHNLARDLESGEILKFKRPKSKIIRPAQRVKSEPSFRDQTGAIRFAHDDNRLKFVEEKPNNAIKTYKKLVDRAVNEIKRTNFVNTINNVSPNISKLTKEYLDEFIRELDNDEEESARAIILCVIGTELHEAVRNNSESNDKSEVIDGESLRIINALVAANSVYVQAFPSVFEYMNNRERAEESYGRLNDSEKIIPWVVFSKLVEEDKLFEGKTLKALQAIEEVLRKPEDKQQKNAVGLGIAALRGALHEMGSIMVEQELSSLTKDLLKNAGITATIAAFFKGAEHDVLALADACPTFFCWISIFVEFLRMK